MLAGRQAGRQTGRQTDRHIDTQSNRQQAGVQLSRLAHSQSVSQ